VTRAVIGIAGEGEARGQSKNITNEGVEANEIA
jgi:hypothetical protein